MKIKKKKTEIKNFLSFFGDGVQIRIVPYYLINLVTWFKYYLILYIL